RDRAVGCAQPCHLDRRRKAQLRAHPSPPHQWSPLRERLTPQRDRAPHPRGGAALCALMSADYLRSPVDAFALASYDVLVDSKKFTNSSVSLAAAIHFAGLTTL